MHHVPPTLNKRAFNCPHCHAFAQQQWFSLHAQEFNPGTKGANIWAAEIQQKVRMKEKKPHLMFTRVLSHCEHVLAFAYVSSCQHCHNMAIWIDESLAWPLRGSCPSPNADLPEEVLRDYNEASTVLALSARAACALLRLAIQKLCIYLGEKGEYLNEDIASLVRKGLDRRVQRALDTVRVIGNNAVHPGRMDLRDDHATATTLFRLVNLIAQRMLTEAREVDEVYDSLPEGALKQIEERDRRGQ